MMNTQLLSIQSAGAITGLDMQFYPSNSATINAKSDGKVRAGSYVTDSWHNTARSNKKSAGPKQATTEVYLNSVRTSMHGLLQNQSSTPPGPQVLGGNPRNQHNPLLPDISGGYIDTGYPEDAESEYNSGSKGYRMQVVGGDYGDLLKRHLITTDSISDRGPVTFARQEKPWYVVGGFQSAANQRFDGHTQSPQVFTDFNANTFIQDYYLDGNEFENDAVFDGATAAQIMAKVRIGFTFYSTKGIPNEAGSPEGGNNYPPRWMCAISLLEVLQTGIGYSEGMEFDLYWPPKRYSQGATGPLSAYFLPDGTGIQVEGDGTGTITLDFDWDDKVNVSGQAVGDLTIGGQVFDQGNNTTGNQTRSFSVTGGNTYTWTINGQSETAGHRIRDGGKKIQWDDDAGNGFDVNATMVISDLTTDGGGNSDPNAAYNAMEDTANSPYYPDMKGNFKLPKKLAAFYEKDGQKRAAKEAVYQESHNKQSPIWYTSSDRDKHRIRFKLIITQTT
jgi:hypothetical protein